MLRVPLAARLRASVKSGRYSQRCFHGSQSANNEGGETKGQPTRGKMPANEALEDEFKKRAHSTALLKAIAQNGEKSTNPDASFRATKGAALLAKAEKDVMGAEATGDMMDSDGPRRQRFLPDFTRLAGGEKEMSSLLAENYRENHGYARDLQWLDIVEKKTSMYEEPRVDSNAQLYTSAPRPVKYAYTAVVPSAVAEDKKLNALPFGKCGLRTNETQKSIVHGYKGTPRYGDRHKAMAGGYKSHMALDAYAAGIPDDDWRKSFIRNAALAIGRNASLSLADKHMMMADLSTINLGSAESAAVDPTALAAARKAGSAKAAVAATFTDDESEVEEDAPEDQREPDPKPKADVKPKAGGAPAKQAAPRQEIVLDDDDDDEYDEDAEDDRPIKT